MTGPEQVLIHDWCQQFPSHSIGDLHSAPTERSTSASGDGASFNYVDLRVRPATPAVTPLYEGGALRSQDLRTTCDPTTLDGTILRIDPATRQRAARQPANRRDANARRIIADGLRNPFRLTFRPGTNEVWIGDVGWNALGGDQPVADRLDACRELRLALLRGHGRQSGYDSANLSICENLYAQGGVIDPHYTYHHNAEGRERRALPTGQSRDLDELVHRGLASTRAARIRLRTTARSSSATTRATASG